jgi:hypothetical protein
MFKLAMKSNACAAMAKVIDMNPLIWCILSASKLLARSFPEYFKLVKTTMIQFLGIVEDE